MKISQNDRSILRHLAEKIAEIAVLPIHKEKVELWRRLNDLEPVRPMVWINEIPWHEMNVNDELTLRTENEFCRQVETELSRTLYQWQHLPGDMIVEPKYYSPLVIRDSGFGIREESDIVQYDENNNIISKDFHPQIRNERDIEKIKNPIITLDEEATERNYQVLDDLFGDILHVEKRGIIRFWFAPWDELVTWYGVEEALTDLVLRPVTIHLAMDRLVSAHLTRLDQYVSSNLLSFSEGNFRVGSGGLGYTKELPKLNFDPKRVRSNDQWGFATAQIFCDVSPKMHEEFALKYERRWLERFGLNYYGCCEPLHNKIHILKSIPNLRKISMSPWIDVEKAAENIGDNYVVSYKPNPAFLAMVDWNPKLAQKNLEVVLEKSKGCHVEVILKDISTVRYEPQRLWEWEKMAMEVVERYK
ncbi:MAG: hypothetical protein JSW07_01445 [bacterium]|nr:MAG: hypothetical protein JSW07_01445 [bacterium]